MEDTNATVVRKLYRRGKLNPLHTIHDTTSIRKRKLSTGTSIKRFNDMKNKQQQTSLQPENNTVKRERAHIFQVDRAFFCNVHHKPTYIRILILFGEHVVTSYANSLRTSRTSSSSTNGTVRNTYPPNIVDTSTNPNEYEDDRTRGHVHKTVFITNLHLSSILI